MDTSSTSRGCNSPAEAMEPSVKEATESLESSTVAKIVQHFLKMRKKATLKTELTPKMEAKNPMPMEQSGSRLKSLVKEKTCLSFKSSSEVSPSLQSLSPLQHAKQSENTNIQRCQQTSAAFSLLNPGLASQSEKLKSFL